MRGKVSSRVEGIAIISLELDERTWSAVDVSLPAAAGHLERPVIYDDTDSY
ncbi:unnamed protein product [marine sediment metagenome]|uniref:Uncharacterized protein n=1 Tax=marine sediment metagenome TaxID=412755 RepID=X1PDC7_9ZZZZ